MRDGSTDGDLSKHYATEGDSQVQRDGSVSSTLWQSAAGRVQIALDVVLLVVVGLNLYWLNAARNQFTETAKLQADELSLLTRRANASDERYAQMSGEVKVTTEKLGLTTIELDRARAMAAAIRKQQQVAVQKLDAAIAQKASADELNKLQSDASTRFDTLSSDITNTREALEGTKSELSGSIARTHDELVTLAHKSDRDYYEFKLPRKGAREKIGSVTVELDKTDGKRNRFTVNLYFDDKRVQLKDKGYMEPVMFYVGGASSPVELVVNQLGKNSVSGYLSTPRGLYAGVPNVLSQRPGA
jgi:hypothetical protein